MPRLLGYAMRLAFLASALIIFATSAALAGAPAPSCLDHTARIEADLGLPAKLLGAIAMVESGRTLADSHVRVPWPWTINVDGRGEQFDTKAEAIAAARRHARAGAHNIDVGCMQISLLHHPYAFKTIEEAFDPSANVAYGGRFLTGLVKAQSTLEQAIGRYHSSTPALLEEYRDRVVAVWRGLAAGKLPVSPLVVRSQPLPDYPDRDMRRLSPQEAYREYRDRLAMIADDQDAAFGLALATERMARLRELPMAQARLAYAHALAIDSGNRFALARLLEMVAEEAPQRQLRLLEDAFLITGGPARLAERIAEVADAVGESNRAAAYRRQAKALAVASARR